MKIEDAIAAIDQLKVYDLIGAPQRRALRRELAALPIIEKLRILDAMRERDETIRGSRTPADSKEPPVAE